MCAPRMASRKFAEESYSGVIAITEIRTGARSAPFDLSSIPGKGPKHGTSLTKPLQVGIWQNGEIRPLGNGQQLSTSPTFWPKLIAIAPDCHVQNVRICRWEGDTVVLEATRSILTGQPLYLWFGEDVLVNDLEIPPYLNPSNIRGGNSYICQKCSKEFEAPNLLKIHLASQCGSLSMDVLWARLGRRSHTPKMEILQLPLQLSQPPSSTANFLSAFTFTPRHISPSTIFFSPHNIIPTSITSSNNNNNNNNVCISPSSSSVITDANNSQRFHHIDPLIQHNHHHHHHSASRQHRSIPEDIRNNNHHHNNHSNITDNNNVLSPNSNPNPLDPLLQLRNGSDKDEQAHLESIVSNMGKAKNGHVCLYCGKLYSRKYGLKIHIRTHTGYRPLKCRICLRPFGDPSNLNKHVRLHSEGSTPYRCEFCGKILVRRRDLDRHIRSRHGHHHHSSTLNNNNNNNNEREIATSTTNNNSRRYHRGRNSNSTTTSSTTNDAN